MGPPVTRKEALAQGLKHYFTGKPCKHGHILKRRVSNSECGACRRLVQSKYASTEKGKSFQRIRNLKKQERLIIATPKWCDKTALNEFISNCPDGHHVDHIIPLRGKLVWGLNIPENLQYLPAQENLSKGNKVDPFTLEAVVCVLPEHRRYVQVP